MTPLTRRTRDVDPHAHALMVDGFRMRLTAKEIVARIRDATGESIPERTVSRWYLQWRTEEQRRQMYADTVAEYARSASGYVRMFRCALGSGAGALRGWRDVRSARIRRYLGQFLVMPTTDGFEEIIAELHAYAIECLCARTEGSQ